jgi:hypothetical protein
MQDEKLPKLALKYQPVEKLGRSHPKKTSSWKSEERRRKKNLPQTKKCRNSAECNQY